ncbi:MAG: DUF975 family protein, partial [Oscillospiraceae bacterium]|nr:DUF975 family protein [Oscillospiraceae bacterium]
LLSLVVSSLSARLMGNGITAGDVSRIMDAYQNGNYSYVLSYASRFQPSGLASLIDMALQFVMMVVSAGFVIFILNTVRRTNAVYGNLLDGFSIAGRVILLNIVEGLLIFLWSLLLVVPGIIAAYRYRLALYLLIDHPEKSVLQCIRESKEMMRGHKAELFRLDLSMIGWLLLDMFIPFAAVWTAPYTNTVWVLYYEALCNRAGQETWSFNPDL